MVEEVFYWGMLVCPKGFIWARRAAALGKQNKYD